MVREVVLNRTRVGRYFRTTVPSGLGSSSGLRELTRGFGYKTETESLWTGQERSP